MGVGFVFCGPILLLFSIVRKKGPDAPAAAASALKHHLPLDRGPPQKGAKKVFRGESIGPGFFIWKIVSGTPYKSQWMRSVRRMRRGPSFACDPFFVLLSPDRRSLFFWAGGAICIGNCLSRFHLCTEKERYEWEREKECSGGFWCSCSDSHGKSENVAKAKMPEERWTEAGF